MEKPVDKVLTSAEGEHSVREGVSVAYRENISTNSEQDDDTRNVNVNNNEHQNTEIVNDTNTQHSGQTMTETQNTTQFEEFMKLVLSKFSEISSQINHTNTNIETNKKEITTQIRNTNANIETNKKEITIQISNTNANIETNKKEITAQISNANANINQTNANIETHKNDITTKITSQINEMTQNTSAQLQSHREEMTQISTQLSTQINTQIESHKLELDKQLQSLGNTIQSMQQKINESSVTLRQEFNEHLLSVRGEISKDIGTVRNEIESCAHENASQIRALENKIAELNSRVETANARVDITENHVRTQIRYFDERSELLEMRVNECENRNGENSDRNEVEILGTIAPTSEDQHSRPRNNHNDKSVHASNTVRGQAPILSLPSNFINEVNLPKFFNKNSEHPLKFLKDLEQYFTLRSVPEHLKISRSGMLVIRGWSYSS